MRRLPIILLLPILCALGAVVRADSRENSSAEFELRDGDRIVFLGNTLIEREQKYGHWETMLTARFPERNVTFRNLGWDGDTVWAESRGYFDEPQVGYRRLLEQIRELKPTVIFLGYGGNEAFAGEEGLPRFLKQYNRLLDDLAQASATGVRFVILSPVRHEDLGPPLPDPAAINRSLKVYRDALRRLAAERGIPFVDLFTLRSPRSGEHLTSNGMHLTDAGYALASRAIEQQLFGGTAAQAGLSPEQLKELRQAIIEKNQLYFHHWRPQNITYLFGFRMHEQGQNAKEVEEFERLVAEKEAEIATLKGR